MKYEDQLKQELIQFADSYGKSTFGNNYLHPAELQNSSLIFNNISSNFQKESWTAISKNSEYFLRTIKTHPKSQTKDSSVLEMQSSNSSDALAMNIFCHPGFRKWEGVTKLFKVDKLASVDFGFKAKVMKSFGDDEIGDKTEVDVIFNNAIIAECKLTEVDFCAKEKAIVNQYSEFEKTFHIDKLCQTSTHYENYQLLRNILAAKQDDFRFLLICDIRRPDLAKRFFQTVSCIKDVELRTKCEIIYWQDIAKVVGAELRKFLKDKYGIF